MPLSGVTTTSAVVISMELMVLVKQILCNETDNGKCYWIVAGCSDRIVCLLNELAEAQRSEASAGNEILC